ncbi:MAG: peptidylprolyl isomerase [Tenericutes bacterium GWC2_34_14]|nr:MAG: peptidylprolyl isomerase [Tenericutes bacterium GWA2_35_7]OHE28679.1 MAG: peptidylprolyl isomerase [Tenericutes bacterium GWC2_34_14]OHE33413.1 MAG: peptidylprolyl isomerase [Tenericutes bacterium GWE2_34_108]OHE36698.1 MAG: peptidylprolyl isomerase [Tenericutes bacterium GWF1_35_14]OHE38223.1 MAG: peptidylprolyl isomerase [Tenericutes bacterium GWF2_35_184]OHE41196.1 MAG: peptidylprolyl isomerase [Tenericutes bacterium RIFOXYA12_FULL_35_10]OHE43259.1 MAG: peptidylprolyl isomerase [Te
MSYQTYLNPKNPTVTLKVKNMGTITLELFPEVAPNTVNNFIALAERNFYDGLIFHRIIPSFMIQGGWGKEDLRPIRGEFRTNGFVNDLRHTRGVISMARTNDPNSQTSQFFIMHQNSPHLDGQYAAFGGVTSGIEIVDQIVSKPRDPRDRPYEDIIIESLTVDTKGQTYPKPQTL